MTQSRWGIGSVLVLVWALSCVLVSEANAAELIVQRDAGLSAGQRADLRRDAGVTHERMLALKNAELVTVPDARTDEAMAALNADPDVAYAVPNVSLHISSATAADDPYFRFQWDLEQSNDADIDVLSAWNYPSDGAGSDVSVAVVDQEIHTSHFDLLGHINTDMATDVLDKGTRCTAAAPVIDHGTHVAGTIVAARDNKSGIAGIAPSARVVPVRAFDNCGSSTLEAILAGFQYAGDAQLPIVVASFATDPLDQHDSASINDAFAGIFERFPDTLFVVAAGNEGSNNAERPVYPCDTRNPVTRVDPPNVICVGMSDQRDAPDCQSNVGGSVDVFAPGRSLWSTVGSDKGVDRLSGTSQAAAVVAGIAALANSAEPLWLGEQLKDALTNGVDYKAGMQDLATSGGRVNAARTLGVTHDPDGLDLGNGGPGGSWRSCDADHDGYTDASDDCPTVAGTLKGCPDTDGDGIIDDQDNCPTVANEDQMNMDGDALGDACDPDADGDTVAVPKDVCPTVYAVTLNGCPPSEIIVDPPMDPPVDSRPIVVPVPTATPTPTPIARAPLRVTIAIKVTRKVAKVTIKPTRAATVAVKVERRVKRKWRRVTLRSLASSAAGRSLTLRRLAKGRYRVTATAAGIKRAKSFKV